MQDFRSLQVWQRGHRLALRIYEITASFPREERFGLTAQLRRASVSIPANIAEGSARRTRGEFVHFLSIASGSVSEVEAETELARDLGILSTSAAERIMDETSRLRKMLLRLIDRVGAPSIEGHMQRTTSRDQSRPKRG